jgi:hypothetical protein
MSREDDSNINPRTKGKPAEKSFEAILAGLHQRLRASRLAKPAPKPKPDRSKQKDLRRDVDSKRELLHQNYTPGQRTLLEYLFRHLGLSVAKETSYTTIHHCPSCGGKSLKTRPRDLYYQDYWDMYCNCECRGLGGNPQEEHRYGDDLALIMWLNNLPRTVLGYDAAYEVLAVVIADYERALRVDSESLWKPRRADE